MKKNELVDYCRTNGIPFDEGMLLNTYPAIRVRKGPQHVELAFFQSGDLYKVRVNGCYVNVDPRVHHSLPIIGYGHYGIGDCKIAESGHINLNDYRTIGGTR